MNTRHVVCSIALLFLCPVLFGKGGAPAKIKAEAEVSATTKPIKLILRLYKTKIKVGEPLWYQIEIQNIGTKKILIMDRFFMDPWELAHNSALKQNVHFRIFDPNGKRLDAVATPRSVYAMPSSAPPDPVEQQKVESMVDVWRHEGLSTQQINDKLSEYSQEHAPNDIDAFSFWLQPGESIKSKASSLEDEHPRAQRKVRRIGDFSELWQFALNRPGKYKVVVAYDATMSDGIRKELRERGEIIPEESVLVKTATVGIEVMP